jgi:hypothetical protein
MWLIIAEVMQFVIGYRHKCFDNYHSQELAFI